MSDTVSAIPDPPAARNPAPVVVSEGGGCATIVLDHAQKGNALGPAIVDALTGHIAQFARRTDIHTLVIRGQGANFCTGFDWSDTETASDGDLLLRFVNIELMLQALWMAPMRTVACVQGRAWGAGADLVVACDVRVAKGDATFRFPGPGFGIVLGSRRLGERVGTDRARRALLGGLEIGASEALALGLVTDVGEQDPDEFVAAGLRVPRMDRDTLVGIARATRLPMEDADLASLVRSAARPGLAERLRQYRAGLRRSN